VDSPRTCRAAAAGCHVKPRTRRRRGVPRGYSEDGSRASYVDVPRRRYAATPRPRRGNSLETIPRPQVDAEDAKLAFEAARAKAAAVTDADALLKEVGAHVSAAVATGVPSQISWGFCAGCCAGFVAKKAGKVLAVAVGGVYILMQGLAYNGYITVDHDKISRKFSERFDVNKDGKVDSTDAEDIYKQAMEVLQYNGPSGGGFGAGMILGLRSG